jgi:hypothetical protein
MKALQNIASKTELPPVELHIDIKPNIREVTNEYKSLVNEDELLS